MQSTDITLVNCTDSNIIIRGMGNGSKVLPVTIRLKVRRLKRRKVLVLKDGVDNDEYAVVAMEHIGVESDLPAMVPNVFYIVNHHDFLDLSRHRDDVLEPQYVGEKDGALIVGSFNKASLDNSVSDVEKKQGCEETLPIDHLLTLDAMLRCALEQPVVNIFRMDHDEAENMVYQVCRYLYKDSSTKENFPTLARQAINFVLNGGMMEEVYEYPSEKVSYTAKELTIKIPKFIFENQSECLFEQTVLRVMLRLGHGTLKVMYEMAESQETQQARDHFDNLILAEIQKMAMDLQHGFSSSAWYKVFNRILIAAQNTIGESIVFDPVPVWIEIIRQSWATDLPDAAGEYTLRRPKHPGNL